MKLSFDKGESIVLLKCAVGICLWQNLQAFMAVKCSLH